MKYIKLFEQFEEEESWWDKESKFDTIKDLMIGKIGTHFYILKEINKEIVRIFDCGGIHPKYFFNYDIKPKDEDRINIFDKFGGSKYSLYKNLPKEIKDRLI